jgi:hypothetical protein
MNKQRASRFKWRRKEDIRVVVDPKKDEEQRRKREEARKQK